MRGQSSLPAGWKSCARGVGHVPVLARVNSPNFLQSVGGRTNRVLWPKWQAKTLWRLLLVPRRVCEMDNHSSTIHRQSQPTDWLHFGPSGGRDKFAGCV